MVNLAARVGVMLLRRILPLLLLLFVQMPQAGAAPIAGKTVVSEAEVKGYLAEYLQGRPALRGAELHIKSMDYKGEMILPAGRVDFEAIAPRQWEGWGPASIALIVRVNGRLERNISIRVDVEAFVEMVVSLRPFERGEIISGGDVALEKRDLAKVSGRICRNLDDVLGKRVRTGISGNSPVRSDYLEKVPLVKPGQMVTIVIENQNLRITARGKAKNSGAEGDTVLVQQLGAQREIHASVVDAGTVRVEF